MVLRPAAVKVNRLCVIERPQSDQNIYVHSKDADALSAQLVQRQQGEFREIEKKWAPASVIAVSCAKSFNHFCVHNRLINMFALISSIVAFQMRETAKFTTGAAAIVCRECASSFCLSYHTPRNLVIRINNYIWQQRQWRQTASYDVIDTSPFRENGT